ncbi:MAG: hypothetical protein ACLR07_10695 [Christensenellales bacterium]
MKEELKSAFFSKRFLLAFGLMLSCFLGYSLPTWIFSADWGDEFREGALQLSVGGIFSVAQCCCFPFVRV